MVLQGNAGVVRILGLLGLQSPIPSIQSHHYAVKKEEEIQYLLITLHSMFDFDCVLQVPL